jgi:c-di-GMP-binding flagellar brake protein YcgR
MVDIKFSINHKVEIFYNDNTYKSNIQDITDEYIGISIPIKEGKYVALNSSDYFEVLYYEAANVYKFEGKVIGRKVEDGVSQIILEYPKNIIKIQRREFVRIDMVQYIRCLKVEMGVKNKDESSLFSEQKGNKAILIDLSGGGFKLKLSEKIDVNDTIIAEIPYEGDKITVKAKAVRTDMDVDKSYICGFSFIDIDSRTRETIIKLIFSSMRKQRKNQ